MISRDSFIRIYGTDDGEALFRVLEYEKYGYVRKAAYDLGSRLVQSFPRWLALEPVLINSPPTQKTETLRSHKPPPDSLLSLGCFTDLHPPTESSKTHDSSQIESKSGVAVQITENPGNGIRRRHNKRQRLLLDDSDC